MSHPHVKISKSLDHRNVLATPPEVTPSSSTPTTASDPASVSRDALGETAVSSSSSRSFSLQEPTTGASPLRRRQAASMAPPLAGAADRPELCAPLDLG